MVEDVAYSCTDPEVTSQSENLCGYLNFDLQYGPFYDSFKDQTGLVMFKLDLIYTDTNTSFIQLIKPVLVLGDVYFYHNHLNKRRRVIPVRISNVNSSTLYLSQ